MRANAECHHVEYGEDNVSLDMRWHFMGKMEPFLLKLVVGEAGTRGAFL